MCARSYRTKRYAADKEKAPYVASILAAEVRMGCSPDTREPKLLILNVLRWSGQPDSNNSWGRPLCKLQRILHPQLSKIAQDARWTHVLHTRRATTRGEAGTDAWAKMESEASATTTDVETTYENGVLKLKEPWIYQKMPRFT